MVTDCGGMGVSAMFCNHGFKVKNIEMVKAMTLWTIQPLSLYEKLLAQGTLHCDPKNEGFWGYINEEFRIAYNWLVEQMNLRIGSPPVNV